MALHPYGDQTERKREGREGRRGQQQWQHTGSCENPVLGEVEGAGWGKWECDLISLYTCTKFLRMKKIYCYKATLHRCLHIKPSAVLSGAEPETEREYNS